MIQPCLSDSSEIIRDKFICESVVFIGGLPGCGKTLFTPIIGSFERVEIQKFDYPLEHVCSLATLGKLSPDVYKTLITMFVDMNLYNLSMSREVNLRYSDLSSIFKNPKTFHYLKRLFEKGDQLTCERILREKPILQITTHNLFLFAPYFLEALGDRIRAIEIVRHPLYMVKQWHLYVDRYGTDARDFTIWVRHKNQNVPFFANSWADKYVESNPMDKVIYSLEYYVEKQKEILRTLSGKERSQLLVISFEQFVKSPFGFIGQIEQLLDTKRTPLTLKEMKKQKVPRKKIADGITRSIYEQYGWRPSKKGTSESDELKDRRDYVRKHASKEGAAVLDKICADYEQRYLTGL